MRKKLVLASMVLFLSGLSFAVKIGAPAPDFSAVGSDGKTYRLSDMKGKFVVLEWHNQGCPFVMKHYNSGNMQKLQAKWTAKGVVWFSVLSSADGKEGYVSPADENKYLQDKKASPTAALMDGDGRIGHLFAAKTTPHMFIIDPNGNVIYNGAIDDKPSTDLEDVPGAHNYVDTALEEATNGKPVTTSSTRPYGCSVKYKN